MITCDDILNWLTRFATLVADSRDYLTELDAAIGDADHGANMHRGMQAVLAKLPTLAAADIGTILKTVGMTLISTVGGASGPLYGTFFLQFGSTAAGKRTLDLTEWTAAWQFGLEGVIRRGKAEPGDKTMIDALVPSVGALKRALANDTSFVVAREAAAIAAEEGALATIPLVARKGRASYLAERSAGHQDPGATSAALLVRAAAEATSPTGVKE
ncbi:MAG TPA: dihydroxyacetone kinase subunit DhaL [Chloroflexota bacterium]|nr:dihydroxyacetone kinase subunit DhaL [Chloroflexota bacterium]